MNDSFTVAPTSIPVTPLTLQLSWSESDIGIIQPQMLVFTDRTPQSVMVIGTDF